MEKLYKKMLNYTMILDNRIIRILFVSLFVVSLTSCFNEIKNDELTKVCYVKYERALMARVE